MMTTLGGRRCCSPRIQFSSAAARAFANRITLPAPPAATVVQDRWQAGLTELKSLEETGIATGSVDVRVVMWSGALAVIAERPLTGVGSTNRVTAVAEKVAGSNAEYVASYTHLHNLFLDEATSSGLVGLALMLGIFGVFLTQVTCRSPGGRVVGTSYAFVFLVVTFGSFHGVMLNEWTVLSTFSFMTLILVSIRRDAFRARYLTHPRP